MATYKKPTMTLNISTAHFTAALGGDAMESFKAKKIIEGVDEEFGKVLIPYHAIMTTSASVASADVEKADPYCE